MKAIRRLAFSLLLIVLTASSACQPARAAVSTPIANELPKASPSPSPTEPAPLATLTQSPTETVEPATPRPMRVVPGSERFIRPPTVQFVSSTAATIVFEIDQPSAYSLVYWPDAAGFEGSVSIPLDLQSTSQVIRLEQLQPGEDYHASILAPAGDDAFITPLFQGEIWQPVRIHTLPDGGLPVRIAVLGDSGFGETITQDLAQAMAEKEPDIFIHTGDLVYNASREATPVEAFQLKLFETLAPILQQAAIFPVVGNHELYDDAVWDGRAYYYEAFPMLRELENSSTEVEIQAGNREWYRLELGPIQLLFLNTQLFYTGSLRSEQDQWLAERLSDEAFRHTIPVFHVPPFTSGRHRLDGTPVVRGWVPLFEADHVPLVLSGHDHNYERLFQNGVTYFVSGGGSTALYQEGRPLDISQVFFARSHYLILDLQPNQIHVTAYDREGLVLDEVTIDLN
ncbi:MAG: metallophosphoesterase [Anaerolineales bacterium]